MEKAVIYFDGVCNLCNSLVQRLCKDDPKQLLQFCSLQSPAAYRQLESIWPAIQENSQFSTIVVACQNQYYTQAAAILKIADLLGGKYRFLYILRILPGNIQNRLYAIVARNRHKWFGTKKTCSIATGQYKERFICS